jgi:exodeoxyribonuclease VII large subunit
VQGAQAPGELVRALEGLYLVAAAAQIDVILLVRGGGSIEDLWAFNDEQLARTIARSPVPLVSGVGHETDFTIADFVADLRAPTPTAAAELAATARGEWLAALDSLASQLQLAARRRLDREAQRIDHGSARLGRPSVRLGAQQLRLTGAAHRLRYGLAARLLAARNALPGRGQALEAALATRFRRSHEALERQRLRLLRAAHGPRGRGHRPGSADAARPGAAGYPGGRRD